MSSDSKSQAHRTAPEQTVSARHKSCDLKLVDQGVETLGSMFSGLGEAFEKLRNAGRELEPDR